MTHINAAWVVPERRCDGHPGKSDLPHVMDDVSIMKSGALLAACPCEDRRIDIGRAHNERVSTLQKGRRHVVVMLVINGRVDLRDIPVALDPLLLDLSSVRIAHRPNEQRLTVHLDGNGNGGAQFLSNLRLAIRDSTAGPAR